jgi:hypothetical protein
MELVGMNILVHGTRKFTQCIMNYKPKSNPRYWRMKKISCTLPEIEHTMFRLHWR